MKKIIKDKYRLSLLGNPDAVPAAADALRDEPLIDLAEDAADFAFAREGTDPELLARLADAGVPLIFDPAILKNAECVSILRKLAAQAQVMPHHPLVFAPGFLKLLVLINRGAIGGVSAARIAAFAPIPEGDSPENILPILRAPAYLARKTLGATPEKCNAERLPEKFSPAWFEANLLFPGGGHAEIELLQPRGGAPETSLALTAIGEKARLEWFHSASGETLRLREGEKTRDIPVAKVPAETQEIRSMGDFLRRGIAPFETLDDALETEALIQSLAAAAAENRQRPKRLKTLLVHVPRHHNPADRLYLPSLGIARLTAYLREFGFHAEQADLDPLCRDKNLDALNDNDAVAAFLLGGEPTPALADALNLMAGALDFSGRDLVGFSIIDFFGRFQLNAALALARRIKQGNPAAKIVLGGVADEIRTDDTLSRFPGAADFVIEGDAETGLRKLAAALEFRDRPVDEIPSLCYPRDGAVRKNPLDMLKLRYRPRPTFDGLPLDLYRRGPSERVLGLIAADGLPPGDTSPILYLPYYNVKGCAHQCLFCGFQYFLDMQPVAKTVAELKELSERHETKHFFLWNTTINMTVKYINELCDAIIAEDLGLLWADSARPEDISPEIAAKMAAAGCVLLNFGLESASDKILALVRKGFTAAEAEASLQAVHSAGILTRVNLIAGFFHEGPEDVEATRSFVERNAAAIDMIGCYNGFYWNEGVVVNAEEMRIRLRGGKDKIFTGQESIAYDEIGGYPWEEKKEAMRAGKERIMRCVDAENIYYAEGIDEYDMFYLFRRFGRDLPAIKKYLLPPPAEGERRVTMFAGADAPGL